MLAGPLMKSLANVGRNTLVIQKRGIVETPPMVRMNVYKKFLLGGSACLSYLVIPSYVLYNVKYYNKSAYKTAEEE